MLKRVFLGLLAGFLLLAICPALALADPITDGVRAYNAKNYARAAQLLQSGLKQGSGNPNALFYLGMSYARLNRYDEARKAFEYVLQSVPANHELAGKARNNINYLTKQQITLASNSNKAQKILSTALSRNSKDNYLTHVIPSGKIIHFATARMPLRVYIASGLGVPGWKAPMTQAVTSAMRAWQSATRGKVSFAQTYTESNADIIVRWQKNFSDNILGVSPFQSVGDTIIRSDINLAVYYPDSGTTIPQGELVTIATHEMGHAIGLKGHSPYPEDIMYFSSNHGTHQSLSQRDANTIGMLYKLDADVQNNTGMSTALTKKYYELYQQGVQAQTQNRPTQAIAYYRQALQLNRTLVDAKFNLGAVLINEGNKMVRANNLSGAKRNFEEAKRLYAEVIQTPKAPPGSQENYQIAQSNLTVINNALQR
ncbi:tetratricopeptide repeat protein [Vampirovibrio sp.]|uniref:tetratricopeptide repeat protein n=1 Tax=Vampirovibrio sp. TaxID=2717857 RepID=UPI0035932DF0